MKSFLLITATILLSARGVYAQVTADEIDSISVGVTVHADPRLVMLTNALKAKSEKAVNLRSGSGFRVQIYNGTDRTEANKRKLEFMRRFPGIRTYLSYIQPQYRLKVGDFKTRAEAQKLFRDVNDLFNPAMIVPDIIMINTTKDD